jgi:hypothetical protein
MTRNEHEFQSTIGEKQSEYSKCPSLFFSFLLFWKKTIHSCIYHIPTLNRVEKKQETAVVVCRHAVWDYDFCISGWLYCG